MTFYACRSVFRRVLGHNRLQVRFQGGFTEATSKASDRIMGSDRVTDIIRQDHKELGAYYEKYKNAVGEESKQWFNQFVWELCRHSVAEELILYPTLERLGDRGAQLANQSREDHHKVKELLEYTLKQDDPYKFESAVDSIWGNLKQHMDMEEKSDLPMIEQQIKGEAQNKWLATKFKAAKATAPTRPHTMVPEKPAALEAALGMLLAPVDKFMDLFKDFPSAEEARV